MKKFKKIMAILVAAIMIVAMAVPAWADNRDPGTATITIVRDGTYDVSTEDGTTGTGSGNETYTWYRILLADVASLNAIDQDSGEATTTTGQVAYYIEPDSTASTVTARKTALENVTFKKDGIDKPLFSVTSNADSTRWYVDLSDDAKSASVTAAIITEALSAMNKTSFSSGTVTMDSTTKTAVISAVPKGYYLIESNLGTKLIAQTNGDVTVKEKNTYPKVDKKQGQSTAAYADADLNVKVGDTIYYQQTVTIPANAKGIIKLTDTMTGLKLNGGASPFTVKAGDSALTVGAYTAATAATQTTPATPETVTNDWAVVNKEDGSFTLAINANDNTKGKDVVITYSASVLQSALDNATKNNTVTLNYSSYQQSDMVAYKTYTTGAIKYDTSKQSVDEGYGIANVKFWLISSADGATWDLTSPVSVIKDGDFWRPTDPNAASAETAADYITSNASGEIIIRGLDDDLHYRLVEKEAPTGYIPSTAPFDLTLEEDTLPNVTISGDAVPDTTQKLETASVVKIGNTPGKQLPSTGGMGTTVLYIVGGMLVILAGAYLFFSRKRTA